MTKHAPAIAVLAVKAKPLRGRFASLDRLRAAPALGLQAPLAAPTRRSHREAAAAQRRSGAAA
ncbi:MAG: hypothetical protein ABSF67_19755 [Roseiarcus sp.]